MTKKGATILALSTTFFYFIVCIVVMLVYKGEAGVVETGDQFKIFLLVQAPRIIFLFGLTVYLLVLSALPVEKKKGKTTTRTTVSTKTTRSVSTAKASGNTVETTQSKPKTVKVVAKKVAPAQESEETDGE